MYFHIKLELANVHRSLSEESHLPCTLVMEYFCSVASEACGLELTVSTGLPDSWTFRVISSVFSYPNPVLISKFTTRRYNFVSILWSFPIHPVSGGVCHSYLVRKAAPPTAASSKDTLRCHGLEILQRLKVPLLETAHVQTHIEFAIDHLDDP